MFFFLLSVKFDCPVLSSKRLNSLIYFRFFVSFDLFLSIRCYSVIFLGLPLDYLDMRDNW